MSTYANHPVSPAKAAVVEEMKEKLQSAQGAVEPDNNRHIAQRRFWRDGADNTCPHNAKERAAFVNTQYAGLQQHDVLEPQSNQFKNKRGKRHQEPGTASP